jgi:hypothetical protein
MDTMHKMILWFGVISLFWLPTATFAGSTTLKWKANSEPDISSYNVYRGTASRNYGPPAPAGKVTSYTINNLEDGRIYYYAVTAVDSSGNESGYSAEVSAAPTSSGSTAATYQLMLSTRSNGSNAVPLNGRTVSGTIYISLSPDLYVSQVVFTANGESFTDNTAPYDFGGPIDTTALTNGQYKIAAKIALQDGSEKNISANVKVSNSTSANSAKVSEPNKVGLAASPSGKVVEGAFITFTASASGGTGNYQYKFLTRGPATNNVWVVARDYAASDSFVWNSNGKTGKTQFQAWARNVGSAIDKKPKKVKKIKIRVIEPKTAQASKASTSTAKVNNPTTNSSSTPNSYTYWLDEPGGK